MRQIGLFVRLFVFRFLENKIPVCAGYLTYSTLLAIVPLIMVVFSVFTFFPMFEQATEQLQHFVYSNFAPSAGETVQAYLNLFVENSKQMGLVSIIGLVVVAVLLISSIDSALNDIWHNTQKRSLVLSFAIYLAVLIVGPILTGASLAVSSYIFSLELFQADGLFSFSQSLLRFVPFLLIWLLFSVVYLIVPNTPVKFSHAALGALFAATFFTLGKQGFVWYITTFPSYQAIYGALATIPIMIVWIHLSWQVVLLGGQLAAVLKELEMIRLGTLANPLNQKENG